MPRLSRTVFAGIPHHITQRGNRRENVFFSDEDRKIYLDWLKEYCGLKDDELLSQKPEWKQPCEPISDWSAWLAEDDDLQELEVLRRNAEKGLPCGANKFIRGLEKIVGRPLHYRPLGRPKKE